MAKIRLLKRLWNFEEGTEKDFGEFRNEFAIGKGYAEKVTAKRKPKKAPENKAMPTPKENKQFVGSKSFK